MPAIGPGHHPTVPPAFWRRADTVAALRGRDVQQLLMLLTSTQTGAALSQADVSRMTGLSPSTINRYLRGVRVAITFDVLERVANGLLMPDDARMNFGLAPTVPEKMDGRPWPTTVAGPDVRELDPSMRRRSLLAGGSAMVGWSVAIRRQLDESLWTSNVTRSTLDYWQTVSNAYGQAYRSTSPTVFLADIQQDLAEISSLTAKRIPTAQRRALCHIVAQMGGLLATTFVNIGDHSEAKAWFETAQIAADEADDPAIRAWVMVRNAVSSLYWNDAASALFLASQAAEMTRQVPCVAAAWAPAVQARALARLGDVKTTRDMLSRAEDAFSLISGEQTSSGNGYGYTEAQLHFYRSNALTEIGDTSQAYQAQGLAMDALEPTAFLDPSLILLDRAICLAKDGHVTEAASAATKSIEPIAGAIPPIVRQRANDFFAAVPRGIGRDASEIGNVRLMLGAGS